MQPERALFKSQVSICWTNQFSCGWSGPQYFLVAGLRQRTSVSTCIHPSLAPRCLPPCLSVRCVPPYIYGPCTHPWRSITGSLRALPALLSLPSSPLHPWAQETLSAHTGVIIPCPSWGVTLQSSLWPCHSEEPWIFLAHNSSCGWTLRSPPPFAPFWHPWLVSCSGSPRAVPEVVDDPVAGTWCWSPYGLPPWRRYSLWNCHPWPLSLRDQLCLAALKCILWAKLRVVQFTRHISIILWHLLILD